MRVAFVGVKGNAVDGPVLMDRIPGPAEEVRLKGESYVTQSEPIRNEPVTILGNMQYVAILTVAPKGKGKGQAEVREHAGEGIARLAAKKNPGTLVPGFLFNPNVLDV